MSKAAWLIKQGAHTKAKGAHLNSQKWKYLSLQDTRGRRRQLTKSPCYDQFLSFISVSGLRVQIEIQRSRVCLETTPERSLKQTPTR